MGHVTVALSYISWSQCVWCQCLLVARGGSIVSHVKVTPTHYCTLITSPAMHAMQQKADGETRTSPLVIMAIFYSFLNNIVSFSDLGVWVLTAPILFL